MTGLLRLVFTDLDGSLLDHHDYGYAAAEPALTRLQDQGVPVIFVSSKTRAEIEMLRVELDNGHPFIVENGAAVFVPEGYFAQRPQGTVARDGYWICEHCPARSHWLQLLAVLREEFPGEFLGFDEAGEAGISAMTGLSPQAAALANCREYSEPVRWLGSDPRRDAFVQRLREHGANPLQGGRFLSVAGDCDKGRALMWLRSVYSAQTVSATVADLAVGDSGNDVAMLEAAAAALLVRSPAHPFPALQRRTGVYRTQQFGPAGWAEGVDAWLAGTANAN